MKGIKPQPGTHKRPHPESKCQAKTCKPNLPSMRSKRAGIRVKPILRETTLDAHRVR